MILADSSAWVEYDRGTGSEVDRRMMQLIEAGGALAVTEPVIMEVAAAARDDERETQLRRLLLRFPLLGVDCTADFDGATKVYRRCRQVGVTPRGFIDCIIGAVAYRHRAVLLAVDPELLRMARVIGIGVDPSSSTC